MSVSKLVTMVMQRSLLTCKLSQKQCIMHANILRQKLQANKNENLPENKTKTRQMNSTCCKLFYRNVLQTVLQTSVSAG